VSSESPWEAGKELSGESKPANNSNAIYFLKKLLPEVAKNKGFFGVGNFGSKSFDR
jgi:hypothetical protein